MADSPRQARELKADILLCDYAEEVNGKLYVMGGGWSRLFTPNQPSNMALAVKLTIPWNEANRLREIAVRLFNEDNEPVPNEQGETIELLGSMDVGRPPGLRPGSNLDATFALQFRNINLDPGGYFWELRVGEKALVETVPFDVVAPPT